MCTCTWKYRDVCSSCIGYVDWKLHRMTLVHFRSLQQRKETSLSPSLFHTALHFCLPQNYLLKHSKCSSSSLNAFICRILTPVPSPLPIVTTVATATLAAYTQFQFETWWWFHTTSVYYLFQAGETQYREYTNSVRLAPFTCTHTNTTLSSVYIHRSIEMRKYETDPFWTYMQMYARTHAIWESILVHAPSMF